MYSLIICFVIITILIIVFKTLVSINNRHRKDKLNNLVYRFGILEKEYNLNIYKKEVLENFIIALDEEHKKLFVFKILRDHYDFIIVHIKDIKACSKKKIYKSSLVQETRNRRPEKYLDKIVLEFEYKRGGGQVQVAFYDSAINNANQIFHLNKRADEWEKHIAETTNENLLKTA
jgi:hypothetical protein